MQFLAYYAAAPSPKEKSSNEKWTKLTSEIHIDANDIAQNPQGNKIQSNNWHICNDSAGQVIKRIFKSRFTVVGLSQVNERTNEASNNNQQNALQLLPTMTMVAYT